MKGLGVKSAILNYPIWNGKTWLMDNFFLFPLVKLYPLPRFTLMEHRHVSFLKVGGGAATLKGVANI